MPDELHYRKNLVATAPSHSRRRGAEALPEDFVRCGLEFLTRYLSARMRLQLRIETVELCHTQFSRRFRSNGSAEFLKMQADPV